MRFLLLLLLTAGCATATRVETGPGECFMLQSLDGSERYVSDRTECARKAAPASTFKIPHALIALNTRVITDPLAPVAWDKTDQPFDAWERDHTLDSSMKSSVLWFYRRTAGLIGEERMREQLAKVRFGSDTFERELTSFWTNGDLVVSPEEQLDFLRRMFRYELPVPRAHVDVVKASLLMPEGSITNAAGTHAFPLAWPGATLRAKTGNTRVGEERVSWLVGHVEWQGKEYAFVGRKRAAEGLPTTAGAEVALRALNRISADRDARASR